MFGLLYIRNPLCLFDDDFLTRLIFINRNRWPYHKGGLWGFDWTTSKFGLVGNSNFVDLPTDFDPGSLSAELFLLELTGTEKFFSCRLLEGHI